MERNFKLFQNFAVPFPDKQLRDGLVLEAGCVSAERWGLCQETSSNMM
jgi:hypothetical protein